MEKEDIINQVLDKIREYIENNSCTSERDCDYGTEYIETKPLLNFIMEITPE